MPFDRDKYHRRSIRLPGYNYAQPGAYFVTICTHERACLFGDVIDGVMQLNEFGQIAVEEWQKTAAMRPRIQLDAFVVMPNHIHGIIVITDDSEKGTPQRARTGALHAPRPPSIEHFARPTSDSIPTIVRLYKAATTKRINAMRDLPGTPIWLRNYYEHVIRNEADWNRIRDYITNNPARWAEDRENPRCTARQ